MTALEVVVNLLGFAFWAWLGWTAMDAKLRAKKADRLALALEDRLWLQRDEAANATRQVIEVEKRVALLEEYEGERMKAEARTLIGGGGCE